MLTGHEILTNVVFCSVSYDTKHYQTYRKDYVRPADDAPRIDWIGDPPTKVAMQDFGFWMGPEVCVNHLIFDSY